MTFRRLNDIFLAAVVLVLLMLPSDIYAMQWGDQVRSVMKCIGKNMFLNKLRTAQSAPPVRLKILIGRELLMFENFHFFSERSQCRMPIFFSKANDGAFLRNFWYFSLEIY